MSDLLQILSLASAAAKIAEFTAKSSAGFFRILDSLFNKRIVVRKLITSDAITSYKLGELHEKAFPDGSDSFNQILKWIDETKDNALKSESKDILFFARQGKNVLGYVFFQFYQETGLIFISYFAIDKNAKLERGLIVQKIIEKLITHARKNRYNWKFVIGEFEEFRFFGPKQAARRRAEGVMTTFIQSLDHINRKFGSTYKIYRIMLSYRFPALTPMSVEEHKLLRREKTEQRLIVIPNENQNIRRIDGSLYLDELVVREIISNLYQRDYADAYPRDAAYHQYLRDEMNEILKDVNGLVKITDDPHAVLGA